VTDSTTSTVARAAAALDALLDEQPSALILFRHLRSGGEMPELEDELVHLVVAHTSGLYLAHVHEAIRAKAAGGAP
jgi:hypothetical protein